MMPSIAIKPAARTDIIGHYRYIAQNSPHNAERFIDSFRATLRTLADMPGIGRQWESVDRKLKNVRVWHVNGFANWLVFYRPTRGGIEVVRVLHGARDLPSILRSEG